MSKYCKIVVLLVALLLTALGVSKVVYAQSNDMLQDDRGIFDPFTLNTIVISVTEVNSDAVVQSVVTRPPIRIPVRPALRSYFRPPLVQQ
jgi:hypothetical protein